MANKKGFWYTAILDDYRYKIKNDFIKHEWKLIQYILNQITPSDIDFYIRKETKILFVTYTQLCKFFSLDEKGSSNEIHKIIENFARRVVWKVGARAKNLDKYEAITFTQAIGYKDGEFTISLNPYSLPIILYLKKESDHDGFHHYFEFSSSYSGALYSMIKLAKDKQPLVISLDALKELFGTNGGSYSDLRNFNVRILNPAIKDISKVSHLKISHKEQKVSRKTVAIEFSWEGKKA